MLHGKSDSELIEHHHTLARYCVENRAISWVMLVAIVLWGIYGFLSMPQRKDPNIPSTEALAVTPWPGVTAEKIEQLVTRQVEEKIAENPNVHRATAGYYGIKSMTLSGRSFVWVNLEDSVTDTKNEFNDINLKLKDLSANLPDGAGPVQERFRRYRRIDAHRSQPQGRPRDGRLASPIDPRCHCAGPPIRAPLRPPVYDCLQLSAFRQHAADSDGTGSLCPLYHRAGCRTRPSLHRRTRICGSRRARTGR